MFAAPLNLSGCEKYYISIFFFLAEYIKLAFGWGS
jgi:hypothetical protein